jgi:hypothetical protein
MGRREKREKASLQGAAEPRTADPGTLSSPAERDIRKKKDTELPPAYELASVTDVFP